MLLDHFHPPLQGRRHWTGFHSHWASVIARELNAVLPDRWFVEPNVHWAIEVDVATFEDVPELVAVGGAEDVEPWSPPAPSRTIAIPQRTDVVEVRVFEQFGDVTLVGAIEFVSEANKDRPDTREAFATKCASYLCDGVGLIVVDVVTSKSGNLHQELLVQLGNESDCDDPLYTAAYRPLSGETSIETAIWYEPLALTGSLPSMPLFLANGPCLQVDLGRTYLDACRELKLPNPAND